MSYSNKLGAYLVANKPGCVGRPHDDGAGNITLDGWDEQADGLAPTEAEVMAWEPALDIGKVFAEAYAAAPLALNQLKQAVWTARVMAGTDPAQATAEGVALVLRFGPELGAYKDAGGHPLAAQHLYEAISSEESVAALPWLTEPILAIFAAALAPS